MSVHVDTTSYFYSFVMINHLQMAVVVYDTIGRMHGDM